MFKTKTDTVICLNNKLISCFILILELVNWTSMLMVNVKNSWIIIIIIIINNDIFTIKNITTIKDLCILVDSPLQMHKNILEITYYIKKLNSDQNK